MDKDTLVRLERLNQLQLTDSQKDEVLAFFAKQETEIKKLYTADTEQVERMVVRDDVEKKLFTRDELQQGAPEATDGYWQVPRLLE